MRASRAKTTPRQTAPTAITTQPMSAIVPKRASAAGAMKNPEPTMFPMTRAVQVASPRLCPPDSSPRAARAGSLMTGWASFRQRDEAEELQGTRVGLPEELRVDHPDLSRAVETAENAIHEQPEILVAPHGGQGDGFVGELPGEDDQIARRRSPCRRVQKDRPVSEQDVRASTQYPIDAVRVRLHRDDLGVDVELVALLDQPGLRGRPRPGREDPFLEDLCQRGAPERAVRRLPPFEGILQAFGGILAQERSDAAREDRDREGDLRSPLQRGRGGTAEYVDRPLAERVEAIRARDLHVLDRDLAETRLGLHRIRDLLAEHHGVAGGFPGLVLVREGSRVASIAEGELALLADPIQRPR